MEGVSDNRQSVQNLCERTTRWRPRLEKGNGRHAEGQHGFRSVLRRIVPLDDSRAAWTPALIRPRAARRLPLSDFRRIVTRTFALDVALRAAMAHADAQSAGFHVAR